MLSSVAINVDRLSFTYLRMQMSHCHLSEGFWRHTVLTPFRCLAWRSPEGNSLWRLEKPRMEAHCDVPGPQCERLVRTSHYDEEDGR